jgi:hypothetical protein
MPQPTSSAVHVDRVLTNISVAYMQAQTDFIAPQVFPIVPVEKQSDLYYVYTKADWFRDEAKKRAPATESAGSGYNVSTTGYNCDVFAIHKDIADQTRANADAPMQPDIEAAEFVTRRLLLRQERQWVADYFTTSVWATDMVGHAGDTSGSNFTYWSNYASSDPIEDVETGKATVKVSTGFMPNTLVLGYNVFRRLKHHPDIRDRYKYTSAESITPALLAKLFEVERVMVAQAVVNTAVEGETAAMSFVYGNHAFLCYTERAPSLMKPSAGYIFAWKGVSGMYGETIGTSKFYIDQLKADRVEGEIAFDDKVVGADLGYFFSGAVA